MALKLEVTQKQTTTQHMIQSMEILQMNTQELEAYIENLALENPVIELPDIGASKTDIQQEDAQRKLDWLESTDLQNKVYYQQERDADNMEQNWHDKRDLEVELKSFLMSQLLLADYTPKEREIVEFLIESLDSRGYLVDDIFSIAKMFSVSDADVLKLLLDIQSLDPAGVGARDLPECLILQLDRKPDASDVAKAIAKEYLDDLAKNHLPLIAKKLQISVDEVMAACEEIRALNPKPGNSFSNREQLRYISPDAIVVKLENRFEILINEYQYPNFDFNSYYMGLLQTTTDDETKKYLQTKVAQAKWVKNCIAGRTSTLSKVLHVLVEKQNDFFLYGSAHKHPLRLSDIAKALDVHESTVSRTLRGKYLQCSWGVFPLNYFLTSAASKATASKDSFAYISSESPGSKHASSSAVSGADEQTPDQVKALVRKIVDEEDKKKPLSDQKICDALGMLGVQISRRTVNKYRTEMGIPDKSGRKDWSESL